jgi:hypothetical protein
VNGFAAALAGAITAAGVGAVGFARSWPTPSGRHRAPRQPGQLTVQEFVDCPTCQVSTAATRHGTVLLCAEGHLQPSRSTS